MNNTQTTTYGQVNIASGLNIVLGVWMIIAMTHLATLLLLDPLEGPVVLLMEDHIMLQ